VNLFVVSANPKWDNEQIICCDTYKGKMTIQEFEEVYGYEFEDLTYEYQDC